jgi:hypothetical protein
MTSTTILAFDIGIKNLAWCCLQKQGITPTPTYTVLGWDNVNLLEETSNLEKSDAKCLLCKVKGSYIHNENAYCARHAPAGYPALQDASGKLLKSIPAASVCKQLLQSKGVAKPPVKKDALIVELAKYYSMPVIKQKVKVGVDTNLTQIHDSLRNLVNNNSSMWKNCTTICLENQPAFKNPTMKSVQMLLFATLRDILQPSPPQIKLVHASKKVQGATKGDAGYAERKAGSEQRVLTFLQGPIPSTCTNASAMATRFNGASKKSDLADALCMCLDAM